MKRSLKNLFKRWHVGYVCGGEITLHRKTVNSFRKGQMRIPTWCYRHNFRNTLFCYFSETTFPRKKTNSFQKWAKESKERALKLKKKAKFHKKNPKKTNKNRILVRCSKNKAWSKVYPPCKMWCTRICKSSSEILWEKNLHFDCATHRFPKHLLSTTAQSLPFSNEIFFTTMMGSWVALRKIRHHMEFWAINMNGLWERAP